MKYVIAARYNERGEQITEEEKEQLVLDCQTARDIVADLNSRITSAKSNLKTDEYKAEDIL